MKTEECKRLIPLTKEELQDAKGGFLPIAAAFLVEAFITLNGLAAIAGMTVAYIENKLN